MIKGTYCLVLSSESCRVHVGALGELAFPGGYYVYVGSALGPGGLSRVTRHIRLSKRPGSRPRWHIDYLLCSPSFSLETVYCFPTGERAECRLASLLSGIPIPRFGCSDCRCHSHLFFYSTHPAAQIGKAAAILSLSVHSKTIKNP
ncbi:MAG TPA: GIY-YIG nuclease family protein [Methanolinea sp.]|nr:GIY-YIG nuclease family protein [Methanolinea sp.]MDI6899799.1 GIY-YIG nuclease family protein [Methanolinea sp.]HOS82370.1 GIY-YIG nuclease family protein [Methanolinea sp.]HPC55676.1 GIY-YIG nuclease family protein [Methanolinea sp.]HQE86040.1 GIY-YIG nuclease family protein [Methanolinea sp.]